MENNVNEIGYLLEEEFYSRIGYFFKNKEYFIDAITYPSVEQKKSSKFQRLEFIGDKILSFVIATILFDYFDTATEFDLTVMHSNMICKSTLANIGMEISLDKIIYMKKSDIDTNQQKNFSIIENSLESLIGAIYCDGGLCEAEKFIRKFWLKFLGSKFISTRDSKSVLQEMTQKMYKKLPIYNIVSETGSSHEAVFQASVEVNNKTCFDYGKSKRDAERKCAAKMIKFLLDKKQ